MNTIKKLMLLILSATFLYALSVTCFAATWSGYFGYNAHETEYYYEATEGSLSSNTSTGFTANLSKIGWQGVWGCQIYRSVSVGKGGQYNVSFNIKSSDVDKYVYIKFSERNVDNNAYSFWVKCPRGQTVNVNKTFTAQKSTGNVIFGLGGDYGDRLDSYDEDSSYRYSVFESQFGMNRSKLKDLDTQPGNAASSTTITVTNFSLSQTQAPPTTVAPTPTKRSSNYNNNSYSNYWNDTPTPKKSVKKPGKVKLKKVKVRKNRVTVSWKKAKNAAGYQVKVGSITKNTKSKKITITVYNKRRVTVKVRAYSKNKKKYGAWSKKKKVKVKYVKSKKKSNYYQKTNTSAKKRTPSEAKYEMIYLFLKYGNYKQEDTYAYLWLQKEYYSNDVHYLVTVKYFPKSQNFLIMIDDQDYNRVYLTLDNPNNNLWEVGYFSTKYVLTGSGYLYKNMIAYNDAVELNSYTFPSESLSDVERLTTILSKWSLVLLDEILIDYGSSVTHKDFGFYF